MSNSRSRLTARERATIEAALRAGGGRNDVARRTGRSMATVTAIAQAAGIAFDQSATEKARAALRDYDLANRVNLLNRLFDRVGDLLPLTVEPAELKDLAMTVAIMVDKRRLEDGQATSRTEIAGDGVRERIAGRIDELARRRRQEGAA